MKLKNGLSRIGLPAFAAAAVLCTGALALGQSRPGPAPEAQADDMPVETRAGAEERHDPRAVTQLTSRSAPKHQPGPLAATGDLIWDHQGFVTHPGQGAGGWDVSMAHPGGAAGSNVRLSAPGPHFRVADRFEVTGTQNLTQIVTYGYETNAATPGWTAFNGNIWDGPPNDPNSNVLITITDATIENVQVYRVFNGMGNLGNTQRPIHAIVWDATGVQLSDGEYWFDWQVEGGASGWANYTTLPDPQGEANTEVVFGDALQLTTAGWEDFGNGYDSPLEVYALGETDCPWDFNDDGVVDGADLGQLLANWGPCQDCDACPWDVTGDCVVDGADLGQLLANWGDCPEPPPPPTGACCIGETCEELTQIQCNQQGGNFLGVGTDCDGDPCALDCGHPFAGDCCEPNPTPYCDDEECCELICGQDPFCCGDFGGTWDSACASAASQQCIVCTGPPTLYDNGDPDGTNGLSSFQGELTGTPYDRTLADDFVINSASASTINSVSMSGVWFDGAGAPGPLQGIRVRIWADAGGVPASPIGNTLFDETYTDFDAENTGGVFFGRPEVLYEVDIDPFNASVGTVYWISIQPVGTTDNFFQLTSNTGAGNLNGEQIHLEYPDSGAPWPTPGFPTVFTDPYDVTFKLFD